MPEAMAMAFQASSGFLAERIMAALDAGQAAGGDIRGSQSAAILVHLPGPKSATWDLRIDNSRAPLEELRTLLNVRVAGATIGAIPPEASLGELREAFERANALYPSDEQAFWFALNTLAARGFLDEAVAELATLFARGPQWKELLRRLRLPGVEVVQARFEG